MRFSTGRIAAAAGASAAHVALFMRLRICEQPREVRRCGSSFSRTANTNEIHRGKQCVQAGVVFGQLRNAGMQRRQRRTPRGTC
jgi:hypothetical protein